MGLKIITDSASDIPQEKAAALGIQILPMHVRIQDVDYLDGVTLTPKQFFVLYAASDTMPVTSQITPGEMQDAFTAALAEEQDEVLGIFLSSKLSGTFQSACIARDLLPQKSRITLVDSQCFTLSFAALVHRAVQRREEGLSATAIAAELELLKGKARQFVTIGNLKYLKMGGRISGAGAIVGNLVGVKPSIALKNGENILVHKALGMNKAFEFMRASMQSEPLDYTMPFCVSHAGSTEIFEKIDAFMRKNVDYDRFSEVLHYDVGVSVGTHSGPGCAGIAYFVK